jgi:phosphoribosylaminoimidazole-succinocarboxamide synthase
MRQQNQSLPAGIPTEGIKSETENILFEYQGKLIHKGDKPDVAIQEFRPVNNAADNQSSTINQLAQFRNRISSYLFEYLNGFHIPTHFIARISATEMMVRRTEPIAITVKVHNIINGSLTKRLGIKETDNIDLPIIEHYLRNGQKNGAWLNEHHAYALGIATTEEFKQINRIVSKANAILKSLCERRQLILGEAQFEFGKSKGQLMLIDELSPLTFYFYDSSIENKSKRDRFQLDRDGAEGAIAQLADRIMLKA